MSASLLLVVRAQRVREVGGARRRVLQRGNIAIARVEDVLAGGPETIVELTRAPPQTLELVDLGSMLRREGPVMLLEPADQLLALV